MFEMILEDSNSLTGNIQNKIEDVSVYSAEFAAISLKFSDDGWF